MSNKIIIYTKENGSLALMHPSIENNISVYEIARRCVPVGIPYKIIELSELPADYTFIDAWEADMSNPHGHGIGEVAWFAEKEKNK
jgi:hypothetical protein